MIADVIRLLQKDKWHNVSQEVEIAKGKHEYIITWRKCWKQLVREIKFRK